MTKVIIKRNEDTWQSEDCFDLIHAIALDIQGEFTACGSAYVDEDYEFTKKKLNCPKCIRALKNAKKNYDKFKHELGS